jgi:hypothetical protein
MGTELTHKGWGNEGTEMAKVKSRIMVKQDQERQ